MWKYGVKYCVVWVEYVVIYRFTGVAARSAIKTVKSRSSSQRFSRKCWIFKSVPPICFLIKIIEIIRWIVSSSALLCSIRAYYSLNRTIVAVSDFIFLYVVKYTLCDIKILGKSWLSIRHDYAYIYNPTPIMALIPPYLHVCAILRYRLNIDYAFCASVRFCVLLCGQVFYGKFFLNFF